VENKSKQKEHHRVGVNRKQMGEGGKQDMLISAEKG
jgi:hypothetical protein